MLNVILVINIITILDY